MSNPLRRCMLTGFALATLATCALAARPPHPYRIVPGPYRKAPASAERPGPSRFVLAGLTVEIEFLEPPERFRFIETIDPDLGDPFAVPPGQPQRFLAFRVSFKNDSPGDVHFQPGNVILVTDRKEHRYPIDLTDMYRAAYHRRAENAEERMNRIAPILFDSSTRIRSKEEVSRLLVFSQLPEKWKEFGLHFSFIQIDSETHTLSFAFHKRVLKD